MAGKGKVHIIYTQKRIEIPHATRKNVPNHSTINAHLYTLALRRTEPLLVPAAKTFAKHNTSASSIPDSRVLRYVKADFPPGTTQPPFCRHSKLFHIPARTHHILCTVTTTQNGTSAEVNTGVNYRSRCTWSSVRPCGPSAALPKLYARRATCSQSTLASHTRQPRVWATHEAFACHQ